MCYIMFFWYQPSNITSNISSAHTPRQNTMPLKVTFFWFYFRCSLHQFVVVLLMIHRLQTPALQFNSRVDVVLSSSSLNLVQSISTLSLLDISSYCSFVIS